ncbi:MAG: energy-coupling factor ABC transporter ATP-binding protein, partial [Duncaniella sp.]|nr:energy-coupling factor ABC transporter ATP-binding protein [Duncaniella sp.]
MSHHYIRFTDVRYTYPNGYEALAGISFLATHGEKVAVLGLNGAGKSTLLLHTNGLLFPTSGEVNVGDVPVTKSTLPIVRQSVGMVFQNPDDQLFMATVEEDVAFGPMNMKLPQAEVER